MIRRSIAAGFALSPETAQDEDLPGSLIGYLDAANAHDPIRSGKQARAHMLASRPGSRILEVGCGTGDAVGMLAALAGPTGHVVGVDVNESLLAIARARCASQAVEFIQGDGQRLSFFDDSFDAALVERTLQHVIDPAAVLLEMCRVTAPGGLVMAVEPDWGTLLLDAGPPEVSDTIVAEVARSIRNPHVGRRLRRLFTAAGLCDVQVAVEAHVTGDLALARALALVDETCERLVGAGSLTGAAVTDWLTAAADDDAHGRFLASLNLYVAVGTVGRDDAGP